MRAQGETLPVAQASTFRFRSANQLCYGSTQEPQPQAYRNGEQSCLLQAEMTQQLCRISFTGQKFLLCNGVSSLPTENTALQPKHTLSLTMSGSPSSPSRGISKCSGKITIFTSSSYSNFSSVISNPPSTPTGRKKHCSNR